MAGEFGNPEIVEEELDILLIDGGMACCGAGFEIMQWGRDRQEILNMRREI